jgi:hypothetical protein
MPTFKEQKLQEFEQKFFVDNGNIPAVEYAEVEAFLSETIEECRSFNGEKREEFIVVKDNDCHRYKIPRSKDKDWDEWLEIDEDDERSWDVPEYAERLDGGEEIEDNRGWNAHHDEIEAKFGKEEE